MIGFSCLSCGTNINQYLDFIDITQDYGHKRKMVTDNLWDDDNVSTFVLHSTSKPLAYVFGNCRLFSVAALPFQRIFLRKFQILQFFNCHNCMFGKFKFVSFHGEWNTFKSHTHTHSHRECISYPLVHLWSIDFH